MTINPVLRRELLERWRGRRAFLVITAYVGLLAAVMQVMSWAGTRILSFGGFAQGAGGPVLGRFLFENMIAFVMLLVLFIAPGYAAAQISGERERQTLALLQITLVRPWQIVAGKLGASLAWLLLLVVAALPFASAAFFLGGVSVPDLLRATATVIVVAVAVAAVALGISSMVRRTAAAVVMTYAVVLALTLGSAFVSVIEIAVRQFDGGLQRPVAMQVNPFYGLADAARASLFFGDRLPSILTPFAAVLPDSQTVFADIDVGEARGNGGGNGGDVEPAAAVQREPVWLRVLALYLVLGAGGFAVATRRVRAGAGPRRRRRDDDGPRPLVTPDLAGAPPAVTGAPGPLPPPGGPPLTPPSGPPSRAPGRASPPPRDNPGGPSERPVP